MKLSEYLDDTGESLEGFGQKIGLSAASVSRIANGKQDVSAAAARKIHDVTKGKVTPNDLVMAA